MPSIMDSTGLAEAVQRALDLDILPSEIKRRVSSQINAHRPKLKDRIIAFTNYLVTDDITISEDNAGIDLYRLATLVGRWMVENDYEPGDHFDSYIEFFDWVKERLINMLPKKDF